MCGRYSLSTPGDLIAEQFGAAAPPQLEARYNIAPGQQSPVVRHPESGGLRRIDLLRWGLVPHWAKDPAIGNRMINARSETAAEKPAFRDSLRLKRCLVPADGFYEWKKLGGRRQPFHFRLGDGELFAMAGLWARWRPRQGPPLESFTVLTTDANPLVRQVHPRMPVILPPAAYDLWLDPGAQDAALMQPLFEPYPATAMSGVPVSSYVSSPANEGPRCTEPVPSGSPPNTQRDLF